MIPTRQPARLIRNWQLGLLVAALQLGHLASTLPWFRSLLWSNLFQLAVALVTTALCFHRSFGAAPQRERRSWLYVAAGFTIWCLAQVLYIHDMYRPALLLFGRSVDDATWLLVGLPLLVTVYPSLHEGDDVGWLDKLQILTIFLGLYLLVFHAVNGLTLEEAYMLQNGVLALCCFVRLSAGLDRRERGFFVQLAIFLSSYAVLGTTADYFFSRGAAAGTPLDIAWTVPFSLLSCLLLGVKLPGEHRLYTVLRARSFGRLHSLSIGILPVLSIGISAYLALRKPQLGFVILAGALVTFVLRVTKRELGWQTANTSLRNALLEDSLTGLGNRILLRQKLQSLTTEEAHGAPVLIFADLDNFKSVNDTLGHELGDQLLIHLGERLLATAPPGAVVCRLGGDEFVVLTTAADLGAAEAIGHALLDVIRHPVVLEKHSIRCTASLGVVLARCNDSVDDLLRTADHAMYKAKQAGRNRVTIFEDAWLERVSHRWQIEADLRHAIEEHAITVAFQPIVHLERGSITGFEALARWHHPVHGQVPPSDFIPMAEEAGLIAELGEQILRTACAQVAAWNGAWNQRLAISVNISPKHLACPNLAQVVADALDAASLDPHLLKLEITESALLVGMTDIRQVLGGLRELGVQISLDDFGTGYSSLSFLLTLPVDEVKVDRSFVSNMQDASERFKIVQTVIQLGRHLDKGVVAEGAETVEDIENLLAMRCGHVQGWIFGRPQPAEWFHDNFANLNLRASRLVKDAAEQQAAALGPIPEAAIRMPLQVPV